MQHTITEMIFITNKLLEMKFTSDSMEKFLNTPKEKLYHYNDSVGREIRNEFKLWDREWKPIMKNGVDHSEDHPDQISMRVIEGIWELRKNS
jgi:hypothetical protein